MVEKPSGTFEGLSFGELLAQGRRLLGVRERRDVSQKDLAHRIGVSDAAVSRWEADSQRPDKFALAVIIAQLPDVPTDVLTAAWERPRPAKKGSAQLKKPAPPKATKRRGG